MIFVKVDVQLYIILFGKFVICNNLIFDGGNVDSFKPEVDSFKPEDLEDHILSLDTATRTKILIISGLAEEQNETNKSLPMVLYNFLQPYRNA